MNIHHPSLIGIITILLLSSCGNEKDDAPAKSQEQNTQATVKYDSAKARQYGADLYGMKSYVMAFLKEGSNDSLPKAKAKKLQKMHLQNIARLAENGQLVLSGPFMDNDSILGIFLLNVQTLKDAQAIVRTDPAVQAGILEVEFKPWYGSAALMEVPVLHKQLEKKEPAGR